MRNFLLALQFLTVIPIGSKKIIKENKLSHSVIYFPLVGLLLGLILAVLNTLLLYFNFTYLLVNVFLVVALIILTGGLHLDGLADTFDALYSAKDKEEFLKIMRDPHIGTIGALTLLSVILLKIAILSSINPELNAVREFSLFNNKNNALFLMCSLSRWSLILPIYLFDYARQEGKAKDFFGNLSFKKFALTSLSILLFISLVWKFKGLYIFIAVLVFTYFFSRFINKRLQGVTGDVLGAILELNEILILIGYLMLSKVIGGGF